MGSAVASWWHLSITVLSECFFQLQSLQMFCTTLFQVLGGLHISAARSITKLLHLLMQFSFSNLSMWPKHWRCICCITTGILCIPSLSRISSEGLCSDRLMLHIHLTICISVRWSLQASSMLTGHASLSYNIALLTQALQIYCDSFYVKTLCECPIGCSLWIFLSL